MEELQPGTTLTVNQVLNEAETAEMDGKYLSFWTDQQLFGVPISDVVQIVGVQTITQLPEMPYYMKGIINLRGSIIPIIDARLRLGKPERGYDEKTCIIVTKIHDTLMGFVVDAVDEVTDIASDDIAYPPQISGDYTSGFLTGIAKREKDVVLLISTKKLLGEEEVDMMAQVAIKGEQL